ncbi:hypothetical protein KBC86_03420 [Candidatus Gracilibacteria bacterium]|nr:hypothetical protein [Candidatus Gracilibacteria bacterium]
MNTATNSFSYFELLRQSDDLVYQFDRRIGEDGEIGYKRRDQDLWITYRGEKLGWVAYDEESGEVRGRPWNLYPENQNPDYPPEGEWVSKKGIKSYVYILKYKNLE